MEGERTQDTTCFQVHILATKQKELSSPQNAQKIFEHKFIFKLLFFSFSAIHLMFNNPEKELAIKRDPGTIKKTCCLCLYSALENSECTANTVAKENSLW